MTERWERATRDGIGRGWGMGERESDALVSGYLAGRHVPKGLRDSYKHRNDEALQAFLKRDGDFYSRRVWQEGERAERHLCDSIAEGLSEGMSAQELSRKVREDLRYPDKLFRRVRNKYGELVLSRSARAFHPGLGVYRSSYKNAMRLARTEINTAYRTADHERWQELDFVKGIRVSLSNNHTCNGVPFRDICDDLQGVYPKGFKFTGWHPQCRCIATPILEDFDGFLKRKINGGEARKGVEEVPDNFKQWQEANAERIQKAAERGTLPHWYRDNQAVIGGVKMENKPELSILERAKQRHDARTPVEVARIKQALQERTTAGRGIDYSKPNRTLEYYQSGNGMWINSYLRDKSAPPLVGDDAKYLSELTDLAKREKVTDKTLWRSVDASAIFEDIKDGDFDDLISRYVYNTENRYTLQVAEKFSFDKYIGKTFEERGFMSTTRGKDIAYEWGAYSGSKRPIVMKIKPSKNTTGVDIEKYVKKHHPNIEIDEPQREVLLARGQKYKVTGISFDGRQMVVDVELIEAKEPALVASSGANIGAKANVFNNPTDKLKGFQEYDKGKFEQTYNNPNSKGYVVRDKGRIAHGSINKQERYKLDKETRMAKVFADGGYMIEMIEEKTRESSHDAFINGIKAEFKSVSSPKQILHHAKKATREQGAELVLFELNTERSVEVEKELDKVRRAGIKGLYYYKSDGKIRKL